VRANTLYYGDNLDTLEEYMADESVDLIHLDPRLSGTSRVTTTSVSLDESTNGTEDGGI